MTDVDWAGILIRAEQKFKPIGDLLNDRKTRDAILQIVEVRRELDNLEAFLLQTRAKG